MSLKIWSNISKTEIKHGTLGNDYKNRGLKYVDIELKIVSLKGFYVAIHTSKLIIRLFVARTFLIKKLSMLTMPLIKMGS